MASSTLSSYVYDDVPKGNYFRYLVLRPGRGEDPLACSLRTSHIHDAPHYEAISYVWGSEILDHSVTCGERELFITRNLFTALQRLRLPNASRMLWADSICINQSDLQEKGHQVAAMSEIYRSASGVLMIMDEDPDGHGLHAQTLIEDVFNMIDEERSKISDLTWDSFPYFDSMPFGHDARWKSLQALLSQTWFTRGWVVREAALAQQGRVIWGQYDFSWDQLMTVLYWLRERTTRTLMGDRNVTFVMESHHCAYFDRHETALRCFKKKAWVDRTSLLSYLTCGRALHMKNPRDRIYAFLDMPMREKVAVEIEPNYTDAPSEVYRKFAIQHITRTGTPAILDYIFNDAESLQCGLPTWVPSWEHLDTGYQLPLGLDVLQSNTEDVDQTLLLSDNILKVRGVLLGSVQSLTAMLSGPTTTLGTLASNWATIQRWDPWRMYRESKTTRTFFSVLTGTGSFLGDEWVRERQEGKYVEALEIACNSSLDGLQDNLDPQLGQMHGFVQTCIDGKRIMITERGSLGLTPPITQEGDFCAIIFGCTAPCVLRKTTIGSFENHFQYVGSCFLLGHQTWEAVTGEQVYRDILGSEYSKDWIDWGIEEQDIYLC
jgi:hypothetical protein